MKSIFGRHRKHIYIRLFNSGGMIFFQNVKYAHDFDNAIVYIHCPSTLDRMEPPALFSR